MVETLIRESQYRPLTGEVVTIGRQTIYFQPHEIIALLDAQGFDMSSVDPASIALDQNTMGRRAPYDKLGLISDKALFKLLGVPDVKALDHSDYEGADIIHDLTQPLPDKLKSTADFVIDGSTLDNVFNPAGTIKNLADLLKPGGRILATNMYSNHHSPYAILHPLWYLDYFTMNKFTDCKIYIVVLIDGVPSASLDSQANIFTINMDYLLDKNREVSTFVSPYEMKVIMFAEKGPDSTTHVFPSQQHYRSQGEWETYRRNLSVICKSPRPHLLHTQEDIRFFDVRGGHLFIDNRFTACDPSEAIAKSAFRDVPAPKAASTPWYKELFQLRGRAA